MRSDMAKVIVERPRMRVPKRAGSWYPRGSLKAVFQSDYELAPKREGLGHIYGEKWLNENLQPLVRFLRSHVGRPWDKVRAEIAERVRPTSAVRRFNRALSRVTGRSFTSVTPIARTFVRSRS